MRKSTSVRVIVVEGGLNTMTVINGRYENEGFHQIINLQNVWKLYYQVGFCRVADLEFMGWASLRN